jgi:hypothetical protein
MSASSSAAWASSSSNCHSARFDTVALILIPVSFARLPSKSNFAFVAFRRRSPFSQSITCSFDCLVDSIVLLTSAWVIPMGFFGWFQNIGWLLTGKA